MPAHPSSLTHRFYPAPFFLTVLLTLVVVTAISACVTGIPAPRQTVPAALRGDPGVTVFAAGDIADCRKRKPERSGAAKTAALIAPQLATDKQAVVLTLGDNTYPIGLPAEFANCYAPTWGRFKDRTYPAPGNHEYYARPQHADGYYDYFGNAAGPARRGYYSVDIGSWHVIALNSALKPAELQQQLAWLKTDLKQHPAHCTLAYWHHPKYSSGGHGDNARMDDAWNALVAAGAEIVLAGHDHDYERFAPQDGKGQRDERHGIREFVVGTGGAELTPFRFRESNSEIGSNQAFGVLKLTLKNAGYEWEFLPVAKDGFTDRGAALCH